MQRGDDSEPFIRHGLDRKDQFAAACQKSQWRSKRLPYKVPLCTLFVLVEIGHGQLLLVFRRSRFGLSSRFFLELHLLR
jgi:hypothetical protein